MPCFCAVFPHMEQLVKSDKYQVPHCALCLVRPFFFTVRPLTYKHREIRVSHQLILRRGVKVPKPCHYVLKEPDVERSVLLMEWLFSCFHSDHHVDAPEDRSDHSSTDGFSSLPFSDVPPKHCGDSGNGLKVTVVQVRRTMRDLQYIFHSSHILLQDSEVASTLILMIPVSAVLPSLSKLHHLQGGSLYMNSEMAKEMWH